MRYACIEAARIFPFYAVAAIAQRSKRSRRFDSAAFGTIASDRSSPLISPSRDRPFKAARQQRDRCADLIASATMEEGYTTCQLKFEA